MGLSRISLVSTTHVGHCSGGPGADRADWVTALEQWVEQGEAPDTIIAHKEDVHGDPVLERLLCPYPEEARYDRRGNADLASSYRCAAAMR